MTDYFHVDTSYDQIVRAFGHDVLVQSDIGSYQGETLWLLRSGDRIGYLELSYGSCTVCDELQCCESQAEVDALKVKYEAAIRWFGGPGAAIEWLRGRDWESQALGFYPDDVRAFRQKAEAALLALSDEPAERL